MISLRMPLMYEIRIKGRVGDHLADALGLSAEVEPVDTVLRGPVADQEGLHGILARLQDMGLELVEIRRLPRRPNSPTASRTPAGRRA
jgi:hypothetical protein